MGAEYSPVFVVPILFLGFCISVSSFHVYIYCYCVHALVTMLCYGIMYGPILLPLLMRMEYVVRRAFLYPVLTCLVAWHGWMSLYPILAVSMSQSLLELTALCHWHFYFCLLSRLSVPVCVRGLIPITSFYFNFQQLLRWLHFYTIYFGPMSVMSICTCSFVYMVAHVDAALLCLVLRCISLYQVCFLTYG